MRPSPVKISFYGWVVVAVAFVTMGIGVNARTAFSLLFPPILDEFGWPRGLTAGAFSFGFLASAIGIAFSGVGVGSIVILPWLQRLIAGAGWRTACLAMAALVVVTLAPLNLLTRRRPEDMGLLPDGDRAPEAAARGGRHAANVVDRAWASIDWTLARAMRTARFWWVSLGFFGGLWAWYAVQVHQTKYLIEIGFAPAVAAYA